RVSSWGKWVSEIRVPKSGKRIWLGSYDNPEKAARAYDAAQYCIRGEHGQFNFPADKRPKLLERSADSLSIGEIQAIATNFASSDAPDSLSVATRESTDVPVSNAGIACGMVGFVPTSVTGAATVAVENLQMDDFLMLDIEWMSDFL
ncbi:AP2 domain-containing protein, partial [Cephalotus follicularis]